MFGKSSILANPHKTVTFRGQPRANPQTFFTCGSRKEIFGEKLRRIREKIVTRKSVVPMLPPVRRATQQPL